MTAAAIPVQRRANAKLLAIDHVGNMEHHARRDFAELLRPGDVVIANDAATLPASLVGRHSRTGCSIEVRLAARDTLALDDVKHFSAVVFGAGDFRTPTEDRPQPPLLNPGDWLELGPLRAIVEHQLAHPRLISLRFERSLREIWEGLARHGRPIQYAHVPMPLAVWDTWTPIAGPPVAFEPPSASFVLDWQALGSIAAQGARFATITHAAGISSTGDLELDRWLPFDEPYRIPQATVRMIGRAQAQGGRVIAIGTTVVRALEHAATVDGTVSAGEGLATQRIVASTRLHVVDAILSGTHERGTSHHELLRAFADERTLDCMDRELNAHDYLTHEFGDSIFIDASTVDRRSVWSSHVPYATKPKLPWPIS